jgi:adenylate cyclase
MTAFPQVDSAIKAIREGAYNYLVKPFSHDILMTALNRCVEKRRLTLELAKEKSLRAKLQKAYNELSRMKKVEETFGQFVAPEIVQYVLSHPKKDWQQGERLKATVMFVDVRRFTPFAVSVSPEEALKSLNEIFNFVIKAVNREGGILNKFVGDGLMALFGAPVPHAEHAMAAARAALRARDAIEIWAETRLKRGQMPLRIGIGVNTGDVVAGYLGTQNRTEYSVIGHAVNLSSRLEEIAAPGQVLVGPETAELLKPCFELRKMNPVYLTGIPDPIPVSEVLSEITSPKARQKTA